MALPPPDRRRRTAVRRARSDAGGILPFFIILLPALVTLAGVAYDAGMLLTARREAYNIASSAARTGANDIDLDSLYRGSPVLAPSAQGTAQAAVVAQGATPVSISADDRTIEVEVRQEVDMVFLTIIGIDSRSVEATATAEIDQAVDQGSGG